MNTVMSSPAISAITTRELTEGADLQADTLFVMPCTDVPMGRRAATLMVQRAGTPCQVLLVEDVDHWGFVAVANAAFAMSSSRYFGYVAQDAFAGRQWLARAIKALQTPGKHLFGFNDGKWQGALAAFGLAERHWAASTTGGLLFYPGYQRHYADVELTVLAMGQNAYAHDPYSLLVEVDWAKDGASVNAKDRALYRERAASGFDGRVHSSQLQQLFN